MKIDISIGNSRKDKKWNCEEMDLDKFVKRISSTIRTAETMEEYKKLPKTAKDDIKDVGGFVLGKLKDNRRRKDCVINRSGLTLDMDYATANTIEDIEKSCSFKCYFYSTHKHSKENPRLRLIIPLSRNVSADEYTAVARKVACEINMELFDDTTYEPSRLMYWPSTSKDGEFIFKEIDGDLLNPDEVLNKYENWKDSKQWPVSSRQSTIIQNTITKQADPLEKEGVIGGFCRTYSISQAIDEFLPQIYERSEMEGRYDYIRATSSCGVVIYDDKFAYSHHASDIACGKLMNAFDLVRIHKFAYLDEKISTEDEKSIDPINLPSYKAMVDMAISDKKVKLQLAKERLALAQMEFSPIDGEDIENNSDTSKSRSTSNNMDKDNWQTMLELNKYGKIKDTVTNIANIIRYDNNLQNIVYNEFKSCIDVIGKVPWNQVKPGWGDADLSCAKLYFEQVYGLWSPVKFKDALLGVISTRRVYHPIKNYFKTLTWDKTPRIDTLLVDYLGAEDNEYVRAVTRKTLTAAVARIYEPGIKFDSILVLNGPQGIGKSTFFSILGKNWYSDSLCICDMKDKTSAEKMQGYWILELGELAGIKKMDVEIVKSFITRTDDKFRQSYGVTVESHPRSNIIVGSTNSEEGFLRDITGNRRFWPVHVSGKSKLHPWDIKDVDQIWAEAIFRYKEGEELYLQGEVVSEANKAQQQAMECDDREGIVIDYLEKLLPTNWESMDLYERRSFLAGGEFNGSKGSLKRDKVCIMEIWCECFLNERQNLKRYDSYEIEGILNRIGGWEKYSVNSSGKSRYRLYGTQRTFVRSDTI
ncbi:MAG: virulence-associated E family protein [Terrisporobacter sp.]